jgi:hypothetical protein
MPKAGWFSPAWCVRGVVVIAGVLAALAPATAVAAPATLSGETLSELDPAVAGACDASGTSSISFRATGFPFGPYETPYPYDTGSFTETGTASVANQPAYQGGGSFSSGELTGFSASFTIETPDARINGTKTADASPTNAGICQEVSGDPDVGNATMVSADVPRLTYEARIATADGTFLDRGTSYVHVDRFTTDVGFPFAGFSETFESSLDEPIRIPVRVEDCARGGFRDFPGLGFKTPRDCIDYVNASS